MSLRRKLTLLLLEVEADLVIIKLNLGEPLDVAGSLSSERRPTMSERPALRILASWDIEGGITVGDIALRMSVAEGGFVTTVEINENIFLVGGDDWLSTAEARVAIKRILAPSH